MAWTKTKGAATLLIALIGLLLGTSPADAAGTLSATWSPSSPTPSSSITVTETVTGCGAGNTTTPSLYYYVTGPNSYLATNYLTTTALSDNGNTASATFSLGPLPAGSYSVSVYGRGTPCFASSYNFTWVTQTMTVAAASASAPATPAAPTAAANDDGTVALSWTAPADNGATITGYTITPSPACASCTGLTINGNNPPPSTTIGGLTTGTPYTFTLTATNSAGTSSASGASNAVTPAAPPATPAAPTATAGDDGTVALAWSAPADNGAPVTGYTITPSPACPACSGLTVSGNPAATAATIGGLATGTPYTFTLTATNSAGTSSSSGASAAVTPAAPPAAPAAITAAANADGTVTLSWSAPADNGAPITGYIVTPSPACPACGGLSVSGDPAMPSTTIAGLAPGTSYTFAVAAANAAGTGSAASTTAATVAPAPPAGSSPGSSTDGNSSPQGPLSGLSAPLTTRPGSAPLSGAWISAMRRITDPYLINEHDLAALVSCAGLPGCTVTLAASVALGAHGRVLRLPSVTAALAGAQTRILRLRDRAGLRARIRRYLERHPHRRLKIVMTLRFARPGAAARVERYAIPLRTLPGLR